MKNGSTSTYTIDCTDAYGITSDDLTSSSFSVSNSSLASITGVTKAAITNGYRYTVSLLGKTGDGNVTLSINANAVKDSNSNGNVAVTGVTIMVDNTAPTLTYKIGDTVYTGTFTTDYNGSYDMGWFNGGQNPTVTFSDLNGSGVVVEQIVLYSIANSNIVSGGVTDLGNNVYQFNMSNEDVYIPHIKIRDNAGNAGPATRTNGQHLTIWSIDKTAPTMIITGQTMVATSGLLRYYDAYNNNGNGHTTGTTWKDLSNHYNATINGATISERYVSFDGVDDYVPLGIVNDLSATTLEITAKIKSLNNSVLISNTENGGMAILLSNGVLTASIYTNGAYTNLALNEQMDIGIIRTYTMTYDGATLKLYVDGVLHGSKAATGSIGNPISSTQLIIGCNASGSGCNSSTYANMDVYAARVYNRAITQAEIKQNMNADNISAQYSTNDSTATLSFISSEAITGFTTDDITITNATKGTFSTISSSHYTLGVTAIVNSANLTANVNSASFTDVAGNSNTSAISLSRYHDVSGPSATITHTIAVNNYVATVTYQIVFHEAVFGFLTGDIVLSDGTKGTFTKVDNKTYTLVVTYTTSGTKTLSFAAGAAYDRTGNASAARSYNVVIDVTPPTLTYKIGNTVYTGTLTANYDGSYDMGWFNSAQYPTVTFSDSGGSGVVVEEILLYSSVNNAVISGGVTNLGNNVYQFNMPNDDVYIPHIKIRDNAGNIGPSTRTNGQHLTVWSIDKTLPTVSYSTINSTTVRVIGSDANFSYMKVHVYKDGVKDDTKSNNSITTTTFDVSLNAVGTWTIYTFVYDVAGNVQNQTPKNASGWYYQTYNVTNITQYSYRTRTFTGTFTGWKTTSSSYVCSCSASTQTLTRVVCAQVTGPICSNMGCGDNCHEKGNQYRERVYSAWGEWSAWQSASVTANDTTEIRTQSAIGISLVPSGYTQVNYIQSSGTQYIDTGLTPTVNLGFTATFYTESVASGYGFGNIFGSRAGSGSSEYQLTAYSNGSLGMGGRTSDLVIPVQTVNTVSYSGGSTVLVNGVEKTLTNKSTINSGQAAIILFGIRNAGTVTQLSTTRIYNVSFSQGGVKVRDFVPCTRNSDGLAGLYDIVNGAFYGNIGSGSFSTG